MPLRIYLLILVLLIIVSGSCTNDKKKAINEKETGETSPDAMLETLKEKQEVYADWQQFYSNRTTGFSIDSFARHEETNNEMITRSAELSPEFYRAYGKLLAYNSDSSLFADAFSYSVIIEEKDGQLTARGGEADQEVAVVNPKTNERKRIFFCGPPCTIVKTVWIDKENIALFGLSSDDGTEGYTPIIWVVNITNGNTLVYGYDGHAQNADPQALLRYVLGQQGILME